MGRTYLGMITNRTGIRASDVSSTDLGRLQTVARQFARTGKLNTEGESLLRGLKKRGGMTNKLARDLEGGSTSLRKAIANRLNTEVRIREANGNARSKVGEAYAKPAGSAAAINRPDVQASLARAMSRIRTLERTFGTGGEFPLGGRR
jgi:hypothetical protein